MSPLAKNEAIAVSIIFPPVHSEEFILDAIAFFEAELEVDFEIIILNNKADNLVDIEILNYWQNQGYKIYELSPNTTLAQGLNLAIEEASHRYILPILSSHRVLVSGILEAIDLLNDYPEVGIVYGDSEDLENYREICFIFRQEVWQGWSQENLNFSDEQDYFLEFWLNAINQGWQFYYLPDFFAESLELKNVSDLEINPRDFRIITENLKRQISTIIQSKQQDLYFFKHGLSSLVIHELPLVSICIPTYNGERFMGEAISSALSQTYPLIEVIISDDGSTDKTLAIAHSFKDNSSVNFSVFTHQRYGLSENCNFSILQSKGEYIKFIFQDDLLAPQCIEKMVDLAEKDAEIGLVFSPRDIFFAEAAETDPDLISIFRNFADLHLAWETLKPIQWGYELLEDRQLFDHPINKIGEPTTVLLRRKVFDKIGFFDPQLNQLMDLDLWWRVCGYFKVGFVEETLSYFRLHRQQQTYHNMQNLQANDLQFYDKVYQHPIYNFFNFEKRQEALLIYRLSLNGNP